MCSSDLTIVDLKGNTSVATQSKDVENLVVVDNVKSTVQKEIDEIMSDLRRSHTDVPKLRRTRKKEDGSAE